MWAFNGSVPGPTIEARKGDQVIVHFRNDLPESTTIHWHGLRVPNDMDGAGRLLQPIPCERVRLRLVNTANARYFKLGLTGGSMIQIGSDGGLLPAPRAVGTVLLVPGERVDLLLDTSGGATLQLVPYERAMGAGGGETIELVRFDVTDATAVTPAALPATLRTIAVLDPPSVTHTLRLGERMVHHGWQFTINDQVFPNAPLIDGTLGTRQLWTIENESEMDHPFHLHGFAFQRRGAVEGVEWKDTINVPALATVDVVVDFTAREGAAGDWLYHCHILEHAEGGMMAEARIR